jgi:hypothetical protein
MVVGHDKRPSRSPTRRRNRIEDLEARQMMTAVPAFSDLPGAQATLYLDFDGHFGPSGAISATMFPRCTTSRPPKFSIDADEDLSTEELLTIEQIRQCVAEDYAPFDINVSTVEPAEFGQGKGMRIAIDGSDDDWCQQNAEGVYQLNVYRSAGLVNTGFVFRADYQTPSAPHA